MRILLSQEKVFTTSQWLQPQNGLVLLFMVVPLLIHHSSQFREKKRSHYIYHFLFHDSSLSITCSPLLILFIVLLTIYKDNLEIGIEKYIHVDIIEQVLVVNSFTISYSIFMNFFQKKSLN